MILTVSCNPAVDATAELDTLKAGEVNRMRSLQRYAGGKAVNVARFLRSFGEEVSVLGFFGGSSGDFLAEEIRKCGADLLGVRIKGETRTNLNILGDDGRVTELLSKGPLVTAEEQELFLRQYAESLKQTELVILSGSLTEGLPQDFYRTLILTAKDKGVKVFLDSSGIPLASGVAALPWLVKPNLRELETLLRRRFAAREAGEGLGDWLKRAGILKAAKELCEKGCHTVLVSLGADGLLAVEEGYTGACEAIHVNAVNTVSCGDSVVASWAISLRRGEETARTLRRAVAVSAAAAMEQESGKVDVTLAESFLVKLEAE